MTVIVVRDGVMAADTLVVGNGNVAAGHIKKIRKMSDGWILGCAGALGNIVKFFDYWELPDEEKNIDEMNFDGLEVLIIDPKGEVSYMESHSKYPMQITDDFFTIGSGSEVAMGALEAGATAEEAVRIAMKRVISCGGDLTSIRLVQ